MSRRMTEDQKTEAQVRAIMREEFVRAGERIASRILQEIIAPMRPKHKKPSQGLLHGRLSLKEAES